jgi:hypothetical protein
MELDLHLTGEEAELLERLIREEVRETHVELRHTRSLSYRGRVEHELELAGHILELLHGVKSGEVVS